MVGFQSVGSLGRAIQDGRKEIEIYINHKKEKVKIRAKIENIMGFSSHKDSEHLLEFVEQVNTSPLKKVFVIMGEPKASLFLSQRIHDYLDIEAIYPEEGKEYLLS